ncbi:tail fiber domain-containing protein [Burkholderia stabilis]
MTALQKINQGTAPAGSDGDTVRSAFSKVNSNVDVLNTQAALTSSAVITAPQALTNAYVGKRVNINLTSAGTINMPAASTCAADQVTLLRNIGTTVVTLAITTGSGDTVALSKLNPGESVLMDTDGVHAWNMLMRGRTNSDNEVVNGNCTVNGNETVGGTLSVTGLSTFTGGASFGAGGQATISAAGAYSGVSAAYTGNVTVGGTLGVTGQATFSLRPTFAGKTPWDSGNLVSPWSSSNLANPMTTDTPQTASGAKTFTGQISINRSAPNGTWSSAPLVIAGYPGVGSIGLGSGTTAIVLRCAASSGTFEVVSLDSSVFAPVSAAAFNVNSDRAIKSDVERLEGVIGRLRTLRGVSYRLKHDGTEQLGVIAQEVQSVFPEAVVETSINIDEDGNAVEEGGRPMLAVNYNALVPVLLQAMIEMDERLTLVEAR